MKIGFLLQVRLKSSRLPMKALKYLGNRTVLERVIDCAKAAHGLSDIVLCTSTNPQDRPVAEIALRNGVYSYMGSEEDILGRLCDAARFFQLDYMVGTSADNPLVSVDHLDLLMDAARTGKYDYLRVDGLPLGSAPWGMSRKCLEVVCRLKALLELEIWGILVNRPELFSLYILEAKGIFKRPSLRLTLDYEEDYTLFRHLYDTIPFTGHLSLARVIEYLDQHPEVAAINSRCVQHDLTPELKAEINTMFADRLEEFRKLKAEIYG